MIETWTAVTDVPPLDEFDAERLARDDYAAMSRALHALRPEDWTRPTPCEAWDVHALVAHVVGATDQYTAVRKGLANQVRATRRQRRTGEAMVDAWTGTQVDRFQDRSPAELVARFDAQREQAVRTRMRFPRLLRGTRLDDGAGQEFTLGELVRVVATRDGWMHRDDLAQATDRAMELTPEHDGRLVADVVAEWARRHGRPFRLVLTGPAGGTWTAGEGGELIEADAVAFCRTVSGRAPGEGLLAQRVPF